MLHSKQILKGNKERIQRYKGIVIKTAWKSELEKTITVRRKVWAFGVEKIFAIHSSTIEKIEILRQFKVRRKSIKFIRDLTGKAARLKEVKSDLKELNKQKALPVIEFPAKKAVEVPKEEVKDEAPKKEQEITKSSKPDDLTKVEGIGPKIAEALVAGWIATYSELAKAEISKITELIGEVRGNHIPDTWPKQASMAAEGKWDELKKLQDELDGGKPAE